MYYKQLYSNIFTYIDCIYIHFFFQMNTFEFEFNIHQWLFLLCIITLCQQPILFGAHYLQEVFLCGSLILWFLNGTYPNLWRQNQWRLLLCLTWVTVSMSGKRACSFKNSVMKWMYTPKNVFYVFTPVNIIHNQNEIWYTKNHIYVPLYTTNRSQKCISDTRPNTWNFIPSQIKPHAPMDIVNILKALSNVFLIGYPAVLLCYYVMPRCFVPFYVCTSNLYMTIVMKCLTETDKIRKQVQFGILCALCWIMYVQYLVLATPQLTHWSLCLTKSYKCNGKLQKEISVPPDDTWLAWSQWVNL